MAKARLYGFYLHFAGNIRTGKEKCGDAGGHYCLVFERISLNILVAADNYPTAFSAHRDPINIGLGRAKMIVVCFYLKAQTAKAFNKAVSP
ncbi:MAG TPA: hypothetical protein PKC65_06260 [Pyrinomonadaceae bacterium]|nr:hypothetical protein [Pyrinomonadaceae bacterium]